MHTNWPWNTVFIRIATSCCHYWNVARAAFIKFGAIPLGHDALVFRTEFRTYDREISRDVFCHAMPCHVLPQTIVHGHTHLIVFAHACSSDY